MLFIELRTDLTVQQLAEACRTKENPLGMCPCAGFYCPFPDVDCDEVTAEHWVDALQGDISDELQDAGLRGKEAPCEKVYGDEEPEGCEEEDEDADG